EKRLAPEYRGIPQKSPHSQSRHREGRVANRVAVAKELAEDRRENNRHRDRVQERPAHAQHRPPVTQAQVELHEREQKVTSRPDGAQVSEHPFSHKESSRHTPCAVRHNEERLRTLTVKQRHTACAYYFEARRDYRPPQCLA